MSKVDHEAEADTAEFDHFDRVASRFFEYEPRSRARVEVAARSHPGNVRPNNEDSFLAVRRHRGREILATSLPTELLEQSEDQAYTLAVADGMGGKNFGEIASLLAVRTGWELGSGEIKWSMKINDRETRELREKARAFFRLIDAAIHAEIRESPRLAGMGTTLTICYSTGAELFVMHAGDSRAYLYRSGDLIRLTRDHNLAQILVDSGVAEADSPETRRVRHVLTNVLGGPDLGASVDFHHHRLIDGDVLLLCTDGLNDEVEDAEIARILSAGSSPEEACRALLDAALERGGRDNVTALVARYEIGGDVPESDSFGPGASG